MSLVDATLLRFVAVGALNTAVGLGTIWALKWAFAAPDVLANACGYAVGLCTSFALNSRWTFAYAGALVPALVRFLATFAVAWLANLAVVVGAIGVGTDDYLAHALGMPVYTALFYVGSRWVAFR